MKINLLYLHYCYIKGKESFAPKFRLDSVASLEGDQGDRSIPLKFGKSLKKVKNWDFVTDIMHSDPPIMQSDPSM